MAARALGSPTSKQSRSPWVSSHGSASTALNVFALLIFDLSCCRRKKRFNIDKSSLLPRTHMVRCSHPTGEGWDRLPGFNKPVVSLQMSHFSVLVFFFFFGRGDIPFQRVNRQRGSCPQPFFLSHSPSAAALPRVQQFVVGETRCGGLRLSLRFGERRARCSPSCAAARQRTAELGGTSAASPKDGAAPGLSAAGLCWGPHGHGGVVSRVSGCRAVSGAPLALAASVGMRG